MNATAVAFKKRALLVTRLAEAHFVTRTVHVFRFKRRRAHAYERSGALQVVFSKVNVALLLTAVGAAFLTREANRIH